MKLVPTHARHAARFAVIRDYQPVRIERELLAHVFEIMDRTPSPRDEAAGQTSLPPHESANLLPEQETASTASLAEAGTEPRELEPAA
jgi:hypothetical protein